MLELVRLLYLMHCWEMDWFSRFIDLFIPLNGLLVFHDIICLIRLVVFVGYKYMLYLLFYLFVRILDSLDKLIQFWFDPDIMYGIVFVLPLVCIYL